MNEAETISGDKINGGVERNVPMARTLFEKHYSTMGRQEGFSHLSKFTIFDLCESCLWRKVTNRLLSEAKKI